MGNACFCPVQIFRIYETLSPPVLRAKHIFFNHIAENSFHNHIIGLQYSFGIPEQFLLGNAGVSSGSRHIKDINDPCPDTLRGSQIKAQG